MVVSSSHTLGFRFAPPQALCCRPLRGLPNVQTTGPFITGVVSLGGILPGAALRLPLATIVRPFGLPPALAIPELNMEARAESVARSETVVDDAWAPGFQLAPGLGLRHQNYFFDTNEALLS